MAFSLKQKRVLIIDDDQDVADMTAELLTLCGHTAVVAYDGRTGLDAAAAFAPEVILLDLRMPMLDGYAVVAALRADPVLRDTVIVAFTAWSSDMTRTTTEASGFDAHLTKPASVESLLWAVDAYRKSPALALALVQQ